MYNTYIIKHANIFTPVGNHAAKGEEMSRIKHLPDAVVEVRDGVITFVGTEDEYENLDDRLDQKHTDTLDIKGKALIPGFVDSHTHAMFGGFRADEFSWRLKGDSYMSIMERGGGIQSTVNATRELTEEQLVDNTSHFIRKMQDMGVTTVEIKTGYGLDLDTEVRMLNAILRLKDIFYGEVNIASTFMGAHAVPEEYKGRTDDYIDYIINTVIPAVQGKADFFDIFTEKGVFGIEESRRLLAAAWEAGFKLKLHADEIVPLGGAELAAEVGAVSADHLLHISDEGIEALADRGVVATLLPLTAFALREPFAPARKLIDKGAAVALATDLNPGSCFSGSIPLTIALACIYMNMTVEETLTALTLNGAAAVGLAGVTGTIETGKWADMNVLEFESISYMPYYVGMNCVECTFNHGGPVSSISAKFKVYYDDDSDITDKSDNLPF